MRQGTEQVGSKLTDDKVTDGAIHCLGREAA
jgi:hypothetical protein